MQHNTSLAPPSGSELAALQQRLLAWFDTAARDLPWRHTRDPYRVLVAEIMLQQTQVDRVLPKYAAFLQAFPTLEDLAAAPTAEIIRMWAGLGYNRRAVNLQRTARAVLTQHNGRFPQDAAALQQLPGIGPYTAGAVACFAFEQDVAFMDTNIRRVLQRCLVGPEDTAPAMSDRALLTLAQAVIPAGRGWTWNQAVMELGALICTAAAPACWRCPVRENCMAYSAWRSADEQVFQPIQPYTNESGYLGTNARPARRVAERRESAYVGSNRYYRGRVVAALRALAPGATVPIAQLGTQIKETYQLDDRPWLQELVAGLVRDGLVELVGDEVRLPAQ